MPFWSDLHKLWTYSFAQDPIEKRARKEVLGAGVTQPDAIPDIRQDGSFWGGGRGLVRLRDSNDFVDLSSVTNRTSRYKEYERLRNLSEIEAVMDIYADESCLAGHMKIHTLFFGLQTIKWLAENKSEDRFLVYCWDNNKKDYTLGWAHNARKVKTAKTIRIKLDDGNSFVVTPEHRILLRNGEWTMAGLLKFGDELMPFYKEQPNIFFNEKLKTNQYHRIYTFHDGWKTDRQFTDEWRSGKSEGDVRFKNMSRLFCQGVQYRQACKIAGHDPVTVRKLLEREGFSLKELRQLGKKADRRRVIGTEDWKEVDVYDLSVEEHHNFCGESIVYHNCQRGENGHIFEIRCKNDFIKDEAEFLCFNREMLNFDDPSVGWNYIKKTYIFGDHFFEIIIDPENPKKGILGIQELPCDSVYRIETTKGKLIEFQQSNEGPDYQSLTRAPVTQATEADLMQATAVRFTADQVVHTRIGDDRRTFYPYGVSLIEPARGPAHQLRLMEDSMVVYRMCIAGYEKISTKNGWKYMKDLRPGDVVWGFDREKNKIVSSTVTHHINNGIRKTFKVKSLHTSVIATETHPFLVRDMGTGNISYVDVKKLKIGCHELVCPRIDIEEPKQIERIYKDPHARLSESQKLIYRKNRSLDTRNHKEIIENVLNDIGIIPTKKILEKSWGFLGRKDSISLPKELAEVICETFKLDKNLLVIHNKKERLPELLNLPKYVDEDFAKLFGFLMGDGCISYYKNTGKLLFAAGDIVDINKFYEKLLIKYFGRCSFCQDKRKHEGIGLYCVNSITACDIFANLGLSGDCYTKRIPEWLFRERKNIRLAFLEGLADAEGDKRGMKCKTWNTTIRLCNRNLIEDVQHLWKSIGFHASEIKKIQEPERYIEGKKIADKGFGWQVYLSKTKVPIFDPITEIEPNGEEEVYDITVDRIEHNFVCNGIVVHNSRAPERRVFYIDVGNLTPARAEGFMERIKDQFRKKKVAPSRGGGLGATAVEERWHPPAIDEDYWLPIRPNATNTRIDTLPGASNLGEIDDALYFRNKLFTALKFPQNYFSSEDPQSTKVSLSSQNVRFARTIERLQAHVTKSILQIIETHLQLLGVPKEDYEDLQVVATPPSEWRELSRQEIINNRIGWATSLKGSMIISDWDIMTKILHHTEEETAEMQARLKIQKLEDFKLQVLSQNPSLLGIGTADAGEPQLGTEAGGPTPNLGEQQPPGGQQPPPPPQGNQPPVQPQQSGATLPDVSSDEIKKFDLEIQGYDLEIDSEERDYSDS